MITEVKLDGEKYRLSTDAKDFFHDDRVKQGNAAVALDLMNNCLDTIYDLVKPHYPKAFRPKLYLSEKNEANAMAVGGKYIIVCSELIFSAIELINQRYTKEVLERYGLLKDYSPEKVRSCLRVYIWRYVVLHELYHIWNGHSAWKSKYKFDKNGKIVERIVEGIEDTIIPFESERAADCVKARVPREELAEYKITQQALEIDADSSAVCMLVNLLMYDIKSKGVSDSEEYIKYHMALIMGALATAFCLFDNNAGANFSKLSQLSIWDHPLPSIRMVYAEEIADACLHEYSSEETQLRELESEWQKMVCDVEPDHNGEVDMGQVFYFTAYTEAAQRHLCRLKHRITDMYDSLQPFQLANSADKLDENDMEFMPEFVWFADDGRSLRGWTNPATGSDYAIKAKPKPIVKPVKIGPNDPCPCGSGKKYKKCPCGRFRAEKNSLI